MSRFKFGSKKRVSSSQKEQIGNARAMKTCELSRSSDKENMDPAPLYEKIENLGSQLTRSESRLELQKEKTAEAQARCQNTRRREKRAQTSNAVLQSRLASSETLKAELLATQLSLTDSCSRNNVLTAQNSTLANRAKALAMRIRRAPTQQARAAEKVKAASNVFKLQEKGIISEKSRELVTDLVALHNVPVSHVLGVIKSVARTVGVTLEGNISERSVGRVVLEGGIISQAQVIHEVQHAAGANHLFNV
ncbi:hypothetical protein B0H10DRAFT_1974199 [Mycena sp. CBHHK59/15]|nr:hypothetical protein B0H10DRAFT_1974199 [Mycena sp. CBHHK59/15]